MKSTNKDMANSLFFWGIPKIYKCGFAVRAVSFDTINEKIKTKIEEKTTTLARKIKAKNGKVKPNLKTKIFFNIMRLSQKNSWTEKKRPWK